MTSVVYFRLFWVQLKAHGQILFNELIASIRNSYCLVICSLQCYAYVTSTRNDRQISHNNNHSFIRSPTRIYAASRSCLFPCFGQPSCRLCWIVFRATLNFLIFKVTLNLTYRIVFNFAKSCDLSCLSSVDNIKELTVPCLNYMPLKL